MTIISSQIGGLDWGYSPIQLGNRLAKSKTLPKVRPNAHPRNPYLAVLESRPEIGLDDPNFIPNSRIGLEL